MDVKHDATRWRLPGRTGPTPMFTRAKQWVESSLLDTSSAQAAAEPLVDRVGGGVVPAGCSLERAGAGAGVQDRCSNGTRSYVGQLAQVTARTTLASDHLVSGAVEGSLLRKQSRSGHPLPIVAPSFHLSTQLFLTQTCRRVQSAEVGQEGAQQLVAPSASTQPCHTTPLNLSLPAQQPPNNS
ncbi:hypothetical protein J6590_012755 [Homalodisca vitripennis]|nr:hypothetical protein J6590_012755 [Homalodisca vitripennis]